MPAIVDLKNAMAVSAVADDVAARIGIGTTGFLSGYGGKKLGIESMSPGRARDLRCERDTLRCEAGSDRIDAHGSLLSPDREMFDKA